MTTLSSGILLAIDPGKTMGWALFRDGVLVDSGACKTECVLLDKPLSKQAIRNGHKAPPKVETLMGSQLLLGEMPQYRGRGGDNKGTPDALIRLGVSLGEAMGVYKRSFCRLEYVTPEQWKGSTPKDISHRRVQKALTPDEHFPDNHNARDAVGIGLWKLGRLKR